MIKEAQICINLALVLNGIGIEIETKEYFFTNFSKAGKEMAHNNTLLLNESTLNMFFFFIILGTAL